MEQQAISRVCLLAGKIMLESGAETYRVEDTMVRIAKAFEMENAQAYATPTPIMFAIDMSETANFIWIDERFTVLEKVSEVNSISRYISSGELSVTEAENKLKEISAESGSFSELLKYLVAAIVSGCFTIMFEGSWYEFMPAIIVGGVGYYAMNSF